MEDLAQLFANRLSNSPLLLVLLELLENPNEGLPLVLTESLHDGRHMLDDSQLDFITLVSEEHIDHLEQVALGQSLPQ